MTTKKKTIDVTLSRLVLKALNVLVIWAYFVWWSRKTRRRHRVKIASLGILSISTILLGAELMIEGAGAERVAQSVERLGTLGPFTEWLIALRGWVPLHYVIFAVVLMAVVSLIFHHVLEARKPGYEYLFIKRLSDVLLSSSPKEKRLAEAIQIFHSAFKRYGVKHVSIYTKDTAKNELCIVAGAGHVYPAPATGDQTYAIRLKEKEGVAGSVFAGEDNGEGVIWYLPRYVPRLSWFFGRVSFPHAVKFAFVVEDDKVASSVKHLELGNEDVEPDIFFTAPGSKPTINSFLSVPVLSDDKRCVAVLNFDFEGFDPLDKSDIAMAVVFGLVLGREIP